MSDTGAQLVTTSLAGGTHSLTAAYGGDGHNNPSTSGVVTVNVSDPLTPPTIALSGVSDGAVFTAGAGGTLTGQVVTLNASAATGNQLTQVRITLDGSYVFWNVANDTAYQPWTMPALVPGVHVISASATDNQGHTRTLPAMRFIVNPAGATPPTAVALTSPANNAAYVSPETIPLSVAATPAAGRTIAAVFYYVEGTAQAATSVSPFGSTWTNAQPGTYSVRAVAKDDAGGMAFSAPAAVTIGPAQPPQVAITLPGAGASYTAPATVTITASATAAAGATISQVEFLQGATVVGTATASPYTFAWTGVAQGAYTLTARATDSRTSQAASHPVARRQDRPARRDPRWP